MTTTANRWPAPCPKCRNESGAVAAFLLESDPKLGSIARANYECPACGHAWNDTRPVKCTVDEAYTRRARIALGCDPDTGEPVFCTLCDGRLDDGRGLWGDAVHQECRDKGRTELGLPLDRMQGGLT